MAAGDRRLGGVLPSIRARIAAGSSVSAGAVKRWTAPGYWAGISVVHSEPLPTPRRLRCVELGAKALRALADGDLAVVMRGHRRQGYARAMLSALSSGPPPNPMPDRAGQDQPRQHRLPGHHRGFGFTRVGEQGTERDGLAIVFEVPADAMRQAVHSVAGHDGTQGRDVRR